MILEVIGPNGLPAHVKGDGSGNLFATPPAGSVATSGGLTPPAIVNNLTTTATTYAAGQVIGSLQTIAEAARTLGKGGVILSTMLALDNPNTSPIDVIYFGANPTASTITNGTNLDIVAADKAKVIGVAHITDWTALGATRSYGQGHSILIPFNPLTVTNLWAAVVARGSVTLSAGTTVASLISRVSQD